MKVLPSQEDKLMLKETKKGKFSVKSMFKVLDQSPTVCFLHLSIWNPATSIGWGFFPREASWSKLLTLDQVK